MAMQSHAKNVRDHFVTEIGDIVAEYRSISVLRVRLKDFEKKILIYQAGERDGIEAKRRVKELEDLVKSNEARRLAVMSTSSNVDSGLKKVSEKWRRTFMVLEKNMIEHFSVINVVIRLFLKTNYFSKYFLF